MPTTEQSIRKFLEKADEVSSGKYLFATKKIAETLEVVSSSKLLYEIFEFCCEGEDIPRLKRSCLIYGATGGEFVLPDNPKQTVAVCFGILKEIADGNADFNDLLSTYFSGEDDVLHGYSVFISRLVVPFRNTVRFMAEAVLKEKDAASRETPEPSASEKKPSMDLLYLQGLIALLEDDKRLAESVEQPPETAEETLCVISAMLAAAKDYDVAALRPLAVAYKYIPRKTRSAKKIYGAVMELLGDHGVIK